MEVGHDPVNTACSHTVNVKKTWSSSTDAVYRVQKQKHGCHVLCLARRIAARCAEEPASSSCAGNHGMAARSGSSNSQHHILLGSVSKERGPGSNSLWPAKTGRRLTNSEVMGIRSEPGRRRSNTGKSEHEMREHLEMMEPETNCEEDGNTRQCQKDGSIRQLWKKKRFGKTETSGNFRT